MTPNKYLDTVSHSISVGGVVPILTSHNPKMEVLAGGRIKTWTVLNAQAEAHMIFGRAE